MKSSCCFQPNPTFITWFILSWVYIVFYIPFRRCSTQLIFPALSMKPSWFSPSLSSSPADGCRPGQITWKLKLILAIWSEYWPLTSVHVYTDHLTWILASMLSYNLHQVSHQLCVPEPVRLHQRSEPLPDTKKWSWKTIMPMMWWPAPTCPWSGETGRMYPAGSPQSWCGPQPRPGAAQSCRHSPWRQEVIGRDGQWSVTSDVPRPHVTPSSVQTPQGGHIPSRGWVHQRGGGLLARVIPTHC